MSETNNQLGAWHKSWKNVESTLNEVNGWALLDSIKMKRLLSMLPGYGSVLEVGCGSARLSTYMAAQGYVVTGLDYSSNALQVAYQNLLKLVGDGDMAGFSEHVERVNVGPHRLVLGDATDLPFLNGEFDIVLSTGLLEHFREPDRVVGEMVRVLKPGGFFYSDVVPRKFSSFRPTSQWKRLRVGDHVVFEGTYRKHHIQEWLAKAGMLCDINVIPAGVLPPQRLVSKAGKIRNFVFERERFWASLDGGMVASLFGCYYFVTAKKCV